MKTKEQLYQRESARPRVVLIANSQCESQDLPRQEARSSWVRETGCNILDCRNPGISLSTVQQQDEQRRPAVAKLIEKFWVTSAQRTISQRYEPDAEDQQVHWSTRYRSSNFASLQNFNAPTAILLQKLDLFIADADEIWSTIQALHTISKGQLRFQFDRWLHYQKEFQSRTKAWSNWEAAYALQHKRHATESKEE